MKGGTKKKTDNNYHLFTICSVLEIVIIPSHKLSYLIHITTYEVAIKISLLELKKHFQDHIVNDSMDSYLDSVTP